MRNFLGRMVGQSFGISLEDAGASGGGAAVAAPAPAPAAAAPAAPSGDGGGFSFFRNLPQRDLTPKPAESSTESAAPAKPVEPAAAAAVEKPFVVNDDSGKPIEGAAFATKEEAEKYIAEHSGTAAAAAPAKEKTLEELAAEELAKLTGAQTETPAAAGAAKVAPDAVLEKPIYGRFKTIKETEEGIQRMEREGVRLSTENKKILADHSAALATRDAELAAARAELKIARETPAFKELTQDEYNELAKENPGAAVDYRLAKRDHDEAIQKAKNEAEQRVIDRQNHAKAVHAEITRVVDEMDKDPKAYPMFRAVDPLMGKIHESLGGDESSPLRGDPRAVNLYYRAAMGTLYISLLAKGKETKEDAVDATKKAAEAAAAASAAAGAGAGAGAPKPKTAEQISKEKFSESIRNAAPKKVLSFNDD